MNAIDIKNFFYYSLEFIKEKTVNKLTDNQKWIGLIALTVLSLLTVTLTFRRLYQRRQDRKARLIQRNMSTTISRIDRSANQVLKQEVPKSNPSNVSNPSNPGESLRNALILPEGCHFSGTSKGNIMYGGILNWKGEAYTLKGEFTIAADTFSGNGLILFSNGVQFSGHYDNGVLRKGSLFYSGLTELYKQSLRIREDEIWSPSTPRLEFVIEWGEFRLSQQLFEGTGKFSLGRLHYQGEVQNGAATGKGKFVTDNYIYEGTFAQNTSVGDENSLICVANQTRYEGRFTKEGFLEKGKMTTSDGYVYQGRFLGNDFVDRVGTITKDGKPITYKGKFKIEENHIGGDGKIVNGNIKYKGQIKKGVPDGLGKLTIMNQPMQIDSDTIYADVVIQGQFKAGKLVAGSKKLLGGEVIHYKGDFTCAFMSDGTGIVSWPRANYTLVFDGEFIADRMEGFGILQYKTNQPEAEELIRIEGAFKNGKFDGFGVFSTRSGYLSRGTFTHSSLDCDPIFEGPGFIKDDDGNIRIGFFKKESESAGSHLEGKGYYQDQESGTSYFGTFENNELVHGVKKLDGGKMYHGSFKYIKDGTVLFEGVILESNHCWQGRFKNDKPEGRSSLYYCDNHLPLDDSDIGADVSLSVNRDMYQKFKAEAEKVKQEILDLKLNPYDRRETIKSLLIELGFMPNDGVPKKSKKAKGLDKVRISTL